MVSGDTDNYIWGKAINPYNQQRTTSGSSGGSAGLVAKNCCCFALGTDLTGSMKGPSAICGICCFVPTPKRISNIGVKSQIDGTIDGYTGFEHWISTVGPMARDVYTCVLFC